MVASTHPPRGEPVGRLKSAGRWALVLPGALAGAWVAKLITEFGWEFGDSFLGLIFPLAVVGYVVSEGIVGPVAFMWCGAKIAPAHKNVVASVLGCVYGVYCAALIVWVFMVLGDRAVDWLLHSTGTITALGGQDHVVPQFVVFASAPVAAAMGIWGAIGTWLGHWSWETETIRHTPTEDGHQASVGDEQDVHDAVKDSTAPRDDALMRALTASLAAAQAGRAVAHNETLMDDWCSCGRHECEGGEACPGARAT